MSNDPTREALVNVLYRLNNATTGSVANAIDARIRALIAEDKAVTGNSGATGQPISRQGVSTSPPTEAGHESGTTLVDDRELAALNAVADAAVAFDGDETAEDLANLYDTRNYLCAIRAEREETK